MVAEADLVITGGRVVTDGWLGPADVRISGTRIVSLDAPGRATGRSAAGQVIDATGLLVMPGGVDPHCHIGVPLGEFTTRDDFESASLAALAGGTTTLVDFAIPVHGEDPRGALATKLEAAASARCDYALHGCLIEGGSDIHGVVADLAAAGARTIKLFTTYRDLLMVGTETIEHVMAALNRTHGMAYVHAEDNAVIEASQDAADRAGRIGADGMAATRPPSAEERAVAEVLAAAERTGAAVYFVHQTTPAAVDRVVSARQRGVRAYSESCPHYLVLDDTMYSGRHPERFVCCPPLRSREVVEQLGTRLAQGFIHTVGSDHCCYDSAQKARHSGDVRRMPNGLPGVETRLPIMWDAYVESGAISPRRFVELVSANPARLNGLYPRKGAIAPGSDADLVIFDPAATRVVRSAELHMRTDYSPYEDRSVTGWPAVVVSRGRVVYERGELIDPGPTGEFLPADPITRP
jgi:dihydropyrimidinase